MAKHDESLNLLKRKIEELDKMCNHRANYPDEFSDFSFKIGEINSLLELLECPETGKGVYDFLTYYAENYHMDDFTHNPDLEALKTSFNEWMTNQEKSLADYQKLHQLIERVVRVAPVVFDEAIKDDKNWHWKDHLMNLDKLIVDCREALK